MNTSSGMLTVTGTYLYFWYKEGVRSVSEFNRRLSERPSLFGDATLGRNSICFEICTAIRYRGITPPADIGLVP
jgi:hypothetical protein